MSRGREVFVVLAGTIYLSTMAAVALLRFEQRGAALFIAATWIPALWLLFRKIAPQPNTKAPSPTPQPVQIEEIRNSSPAAPVRDCRLPEGPALCPHLAPLEMAIRSAGYHARLKYPHCVEAMLQWRLPLEGLPPCVVEDSFEFTIDRDRYGLTRLRCTLCGDAIEETVHGPFWPPTSPSPPATP